MLDGLAGGLGERVGSDGECRRQLATAEDLHEAAFGDEPVGAQRVGIDGLTSFEVVEGVEVDDRVLDPEWVLEALGLRGPAGDRRLSALEVGFDRVAGTLAFRPSAGGLAALAGDPAADTVGGGLGARGGFEIVQFDGHVS